jgi:hypothetical protein
MPRPGEGTFVRSIGHADQHKRLISAEQFDAGGERP